MQSRSPRSAVMRARRAGPALTTLALALAAVMPAYAQQADAPGAGELDTVQVLGSRAKNRTAAETAGAELLSGELAIFILVQLQQLAWSLFHFRCRKDCVSVGIQNGRDGRREFLGAVAVLRTRAAALALLRTNC